MKDRDPRSDGTARNVYRDLRLRNERRMKLASMSEGRRVSQIERVIELSREFRFHGPRK